MLRIILVTLPMCVVLAMPQDTEIAKSTQEYEECLSKTMVQSHQQYVQDHSDEISWLVRTVVDSLIVQSDLTKLRASIDSLEAQLTGLIDLFPEAKYPLKDFSGFSHWQIGVSSRLAQAEAERDSLRAMIKRAHVVLVPCRVPVKRSNQYWDENGRPQMDIYTVWVDSTCYEISFEGEKEE